MSKFCDKCGAELKENVKFCDKCGAEVKITNNQSNAGATNMGGSVICPHCNQPTPMGQAVCANCGSSLENNTVAVVIGYIATILFGIIGVIPAIYLLTRNNGKAKTQGLILIALFAVWAFCAIVFPPWVKYLFSIIIVIIGIAIWFSDYTIIE